ncbi:MAG: LysR family transcriptional regulator [Burkholderiaceae bacterium]|jgi:DNA-binding transcriptional LysR family regulator|nr:LysR family transcriptional regulator [Burkholderiaceae bacterium]
MDRVDLLRIFLRVAATGSFSQAADQLSIPRPTVSLAVQQLEARLGARLLHRTTRKVSLTPDGQALVERASPLVDDMLELEQRFRSPPQTIAGRLRIDVPSRIARIVIAPALPGLLARHPALRIDLGSSDRAVDLVLEQVDCALRVGPLPDSSLIARRLGSMPLINCASPDYLARHGVPHGPDDLGQHQAVHYNSPTTGRAAPWEWMEDGGERTCMLGGAVGVNNAESYIACALAGLGLIQIPRYDVQAHLQAGELAEVMPAYRPAPMDVHVLYPHRAHLSARVRVFIDWIEQLLRQAGALDDAVAS